MIVFPNAKINLGLFIRKRRSDGFHEIETIMLPVGLCDALEITPALNNQFSFIATGIPVDSPVEKISCVAAYRMLQHQFKLPAVSMHMHKVIPSGAGLGGGSSDGAFAIKLLNRLFGLKLCNQAMSELASELGSDCAFFIQNRPALALGRGEIIVPINQLLKPLFLVLVKPSVSVPTPWAYSLINPADRALPNALPAEVESWKELFTNDFEEQVMKHYPVIGEIKRTLLKMGASFVSMSGSGSSVYGIFKSPPLIDPALRGFFIWKGWI